MPERVKNELLKYMLVGLACLGIILGIVMVIISLRPAPVPAILFPPPTPPFNEFIAAEGMLEASSDNISLGTPYTEIVEKVYVLPGDRVKQGDPLFKLNTDSVLARVEESKKALAVAQAKYQRELDLPRPEDLSIQKALMMQTRAVLEGKAAEFALLENISNPKAISKEEFIDKEYLTLEAKYKLEEAEKRYERLQAGAWVRDLEISRAELKEAEAKAAVTETELLHYTIRAPMDGVILQSHVQAGRIAEASSELKESLMMFGADGPLHIRVNVNEEEVWRFIAGAPGRAYVRGNSDISVSLKYLYTVPFLIPKTALTGSDTERTDTRILQIVYEVEEGETLPLFPGMLMDVYLKAEPYKKRISGKER